MKSKFKRRDKNKPDKRPWLNPNYDAARSDKKRIPLPTDRERWIATVYIAKAMLKAFCWRRWMIAFIDKEGNALPYQEGTIQYE